MFAAATIAHTCILLYVAVAASRSLIFDRSSPIAEPIWKLIILTFLTPMQKELECTKIKDGLYLGNITTAQDAEFLVTNKFAFVVNCSVEAPNFYEGQGVKYLKFKLVKDKPHKLWDETLKKLKKLDKFIQTCEDSSMCCLIHSYNGVNRSLVMLAAFLMHRYRWRLGKTLEFIRSKQVFIGLSEHYIDQLQKLQQILMDSQPDLTSEWRIEYKTIEEELISKTYLNSQEMEIKEPSKREKAVKRIKWQDLVDKEKKKEQKNIKQQQARKPQPQPNVAVVESNEVKETFIKKKAKSEQQVNKEKLWLKRPKIVGNKSKPEIALRETELINKKSLQKVKQPKQAKDQELQGIDEDIIDMIKKNLKYKKKVESNCEANENENEERVYNVTINNYIKPSINIVGLVEKKPKKRPQSAFKKTRPM